ncbi:MAG: lysophospholipid acyltransferase family protein [Pirellulales bacterium]
MQRVVFDEPYQFIPPYYSNWGPHILRHYVRRYIRTAYGVHSVESRHIERLRESIQAGNSVMLAPNHCRLADPMVLGVMALDVPTYLFAMASWHLFKESAFQTFIIRALGAFSVLREGNDRKSLEAAIDILVEGKRPLIVFPEGALTKHCDLIREMMDGPTFLARQALKRLRKAGSPRGVVIHPVAVRYSFDGDIEKTVGPLLDQLEARLSWQPKHNLLMFQRIAKLGDAFLALKEIEYLGAAKTGNLYDRAEVFINTVLARVEDAWQQKDRSGGVVARVKRLRTLILADMVAGRVTPAEREQRWYDLAALYYAQQISHYPQDYITAGKNLPERVIETVERLMEDFTDQSPLVEPLRAVVEIGEAIPVGIEKDRDAEGDPIMAEVRRQLQSMMDGLAAERTPI